MRATFNGDCTACKQFRPRCARVFVRGRFGAMILCDVCRKEFKGQYTLDEKHKSAVKPDPGKTEGEP